jgi:hypothetical protein
VETFFNLLWVAVTIMLGAAWLANLQDRRKKSLLPAIGVQLVALAVLAAILLPVISLTDDLQANTAPAETERVTRSGDLQLAPDQPLHRWPAILAPFVAAPISSQMPATVFSAAAETVQRQAYGFFRAFTTRPPPLA